MDHLTSPKLQHGVHCLNIRHKGMFVTSGPDPDEFAHALTSLRTWARYNGWEVDEENA